MADFIPFPGGNHFLFHAPSTPRVGRIHCRPRRQKEDYAREDCDNHGFSGLERCACFLPDLIICMTYKEYPILMGKMNTG